MDAQDRPGWNPPEAPAHTAPGDAATSPRGPRRSRVGTGVAVAAIAVGALGVAGTAYAASSSSAPTTGVRTISYANAGASGPSGAAGPRGWGRGDGGPGMHGMGPGMGMGRGMDLDGMGPGGAVRGTASVPKQGGGYQTLDMQTGKVDEVSSTSLTVTSADGVQWTYVVNASTIVHAKSAGITSIVKGDTVSVVAVENGSTRTALQVVDRTQVGAARQQWAPPRPPGGPTGQSGPNPSQTG